jgi:ribosomal protein S18 acetylase RimI-like enzyme
LPVVEIRPAEPADLDAVFALLTARNMAAFGLSELRREHLEQAWALAGTEAFVAGNGTLAGYAVLDSGGDAGFAGEDDAALDALLATVTARARDRGFEHVTASVEPADVPYDALVRRGGFEARGEVLRMWRDLALPAPDPAWPDGVSVRTYRSGDARPLHAFLDGAYRDWDETYISQPHEDWLKWMTDHDEFDPELWLLAERAHELVGCALYWAVHEQQGWLKDLAVRADERGRGLAKALVADGFRRYRARGARRVGLKVESTNPTGAPQLYAKLGFETDRRYVTWVKPL